LAGFWAGALRSEHVVLVPPAVAGLVGAGASGACPAGADGEARYCPDDGSIRYDRDWLEALHATFGPGPVAMVLAHAWGHLIQAATTTPFGPLRAQLQADCLAGIYLGRLVDAGRLSTVDVTRAHRSSYRIPDTSASSAP